MIYLYHHIELYRGSDCNAEHGASSDCNAEHGASSSLAGADGGTAGGPHAAAGRERPPTVFYKRIVMSELEATRAKAVAAPLKLARDVRSRARPALRCREPCATRAATRGGGQPVRAVRGRRMGCGIVDQGAAPTAGPLTGPLTDSPRAPARAVAVYEIQLAKTDKVSTSVSECICKCNCIYCIAIVYIL